MKKILLMISLVVIGLFLIGCASQEALSGEAIKVQKQTTPVISGNIENYVISLGYEVVSTTTEGCNAMATCPSGKYVTGGGCSIIGEVGNANLVSSSPTVFELGTRPVNWVCHYSDSKYGCSSSLKRETKAYVICANVG